MHVELWIYVLVFSDFQCLNDFVYEKKIKSKNLSGEGGIYYFRRTHQHTSGPILNIKIMIQIPSGFIK
jgi:hypothetical protein